MKVSEFTRVDPLYEQLASSLDKLYKRYHRRRRVMPYDWSADELHDELLHSPVMDLAAGRGEMLTFSKALYRDYFVAAYVAAAGVVSKVAREFAAGLEDGQLDAFSFLLGIDAEAASLVDYVPRKLLPAVTQIWLEERGEGGLTPVALQQAYREERGSNNFNLFEFAETDGGAALMRSLDDPDPRVRLAAVSATAKTTPFDCAPAMTVDSSRRAQWLWSDDVRRCPQMSGS